MLEDLIKPIANIIDKSVKDKDQALRLSHEIAVLSEKYKNDRSKAQIKVNQAEANGNWFQSSWRPLCGYVCVLGFAVNFLISPIAAGFGFTVPQSDMSQMLPLLTGLLGLGVMRSYEKTKTQQNEK